MELIKGIVFYFINNVLNKIPSRRIRICFYYLLSNGKISLKSNIGLNVKFLDIRGVTIGDNSNINFNCIIDGRGEGIVIGENVDVAPQVNIWSLEHDPNSEIFSSRSNKVIIENNVWIANRSIILPGSFIKELSIIGAGSVVSGLTKKSGIYLGSKAELKKLRSKKVNSYILRKIRNFR